MFNQIWSGLTTLERLTLMTLYVNELESSEYDAWITTSSLCRLIGTINDSNVRKVLHSLWRRGFVTREPVKLNGRNYKWAIGALTREKIETMVGLEVHG